MPADRTETTARKRHIGRAACLAALVALLPPGLAYADDAALCSDTQNTQDAAFAACDRLINSGKGDLASRYRDRGLHSYKKNDLDRALSDFNEAIALNPKFASAYVDRGNVWYARKQYDMALADYDMAIGLSPNALAYGNRGNTWRIKGDLDRAMADFDKAISLDPKNVFAYRNRGNVWNAKRDYARAISDFDQVLALDQKDVGGFTGRAFARWQKGDREAAVADYDRAIGLDPNNADIYNSRGQVLDALNNRDRAVEDYGRAIALRPGFAFALLNRGRDFIVKNDLDRGIEDFDKAINASSNYRDAYLNRGNAWVRKGDFDRAFADLDKAVAIDPRNSSGYDSRGLAWNARSKVDRKNGDVDRAKADVDASLKDFAQAIELNPKFHGHYINRGITRSDMGDLDGAIADYGEAIKLNANDPTTYNNRCGVLRRKNDLDGAIADCNSAIRLDPSYVSAYTTRGQIFESKGDTASAIADYAKAVVLPIKYASGQGAHDTAKARLAVLDPGGEKTPVQTSAASGGRLALVIGNGAYAAPDNLDNPPKDARAIAKALRDIGFDVVEGIDLDHAAMTRNLRTFMLKAASARVALVFYAGHGVQIRGQNYLVPTDAKLATEAAVELELINLDTQILAALDDQARANIVILDSCRNNPFANAGKRGKAASGLAVPANGGSLVAFATDPNNVALDGDGAPHSPFTTALLQYIADPNLELVTMLRRVQNAVRTATHGEQNPYIGLPPFGELYLARDPRQASAK